MSPSAAESLATYLRNLNDGFLAVVTGAGVSVASGIPTFRGTDPDAVWKRDVTELGTWRYFQEDPVGSWSWYTSRFDHVLEKSPNPAHGAIAAIERWQLERGGRFLLITQNVDTLHEDAGSRQMIKVHGSADRVRCTRRGCENAAPSGSLARADIDMQPFFDNPTQDTLPRCSICRAILRQHVLWFDEFYDGHRDYQWWRVLAAASEMNGALFVGTSFAVGVTDLFLQAARETGVSAYSIDPAARASAHPSMTSLAEPSEELLPEVCRILGIELAKQQSSLLRCTE